MPFCLIALFLLGSVCAKVSDDVLLTKKFIHPPGSKIGLFSPGVMVGKTLYVAGKGDQIPGGIAEKESSADADNLGLYRWTGKMVGILTGNAPVVIYNIEKGFNACNNAGIGGVFIQFKREHGFVPHQVSELRDQHRIRPARIIGDI